jgi:hypothetical protein
MKLAIECPVKLLPTIQPLTDFDWILAQQAITNNQYADHYKNSNRLKILDNGVSELSFPVRLIDLKWAAERVNPSYIVPRDYFRGAQSTIDSLKGATRMFGKKKILPVIQGRDMREMLRCAETIAKMGFTRVCVPHRGFCKKGSTYAEMADQRIDIITKIYYWFEWIHLLGLNTLEEFKAYQNAPRVKSMDTGIPYLYGAHGRRFGIHEHFVRRPKIDYSSEDTTHMEDILYNLAHLRMVLEVSTNGFPKRPKAKAVFTAGR